MKLNDITRREVAKLDDEELAKLHSNLHGVDKQAGVSVKGREREIWEAHDIVSAEMVSRGRAHKSPLGSADPLDIEGSPAGTNVNAEDMVLGGAIESRAKAVPIEHIKGPDGASSLLKPYPDYHACRVNDPDKYKEISYVKDEFGDGVDVIYGIYEKDGEDVSEVQAIRFDKDEFTSAEAEAWVKEHDYKCIEFEAASEKADKYACECLDCGHVMETDKHCRDIKCEECSGEMRRKDRPGVGKGMRVSIGKSWFLFEHMRAALEAAFRGNAYAEEYDLDGPAVIAFVNGGDGQGNMQYYRIPFSINEDGNIKLDLTSKEKVDRKTIYVKKLAAATKMIVSKKWFLLQNLQAALAEAFGDNNAYLTEMDAEGPAAIVSVWDADSNQKYYRINFTINAGGGLELDMEHKVELEQQVDWVAKTANVTFTGELIKTNDEDRFALFLVYAPNKLDSQKEWANPREIEKACWNFGAKCYQDAGGHVDVDHDERAYKYKGAVVVENAYLRNGMGKGLGLPDGSWIVGFRFDDKLWKRVKNKELNAVSIGGKAARRKKQCPDKSKAGKTMIQGEIKKSFVKEGDDADENELVDMDIEFMSLVPKGANYTQVDGDTLLLMKSADAVRRENDTKENIVDKKELERRLASIKTEKALLESELGKLADGDDDKGKDDGAANAQAQVPAQPREDMGLVDRLVDAERKIGEMSVKHENELARLKEENDHLRSDKDELVRELETIGESLALQPDADPKE